MARTEPTHPDRAVIALGYGPPHLMGGQYNGQSVVGRGVTDGWEGPNSDFDDVFRVFVYGPIIWLHSLLRMTNHKSHYKDHAIHLGGTSFH